MSTVTAPRAKRQKQVFKHSREVAHVWAQQRQAYGKNPTGNIYFDGHTIFSYGSHFPIARFVYGKGGKPCMIDGKQVVLFTTRTYSPTTNGHLNDVRNALRGLPVQVIHVDRPEFYASQKDNLADLWLSLEVQAESNVKARENCLCGAMANGVANLKLFTRFAGIGKTKRLTKLVSLMRGNQAGWWYPLANLTLERAAEIDNAKSVRRSHRMTREASKRALERIAAEKRQSVYADVKPLAIEAWRNGLDVLTISAELVAKHELDLNSTTVKTSQFLPASWNEGALLRIVGDEIETSRGAFVPVRHAIRAWEHLKRHELPTDRIGEYHADSFQGDVLAIGCHRIAFAEIERIARQLGFSV
jgi:hypothetical protein